jgi:GNAT superfamily N-acetyltransferase
MAAVAARGGVAADRVIRPARATDVDALTRAHLAAFLAGNGPALPPNVLARITGERMRERWERHFAEPLTGSLLLVAECGGRIVGTAASGPLRDDDDEAAAAAGELYSLYVEPSVWGMGNGAALHDTALAHLAASGFDSALLWVLEGNARARSFYVAHGWSRTAPATTGKVRRCCGWPATSGNDERRPMGASRVLPDWTESPSWNVA